jgi:predicted DCC family thiol-disulfide oxidoreductase YuxK
VATTVLFDAGCGFCRWSTNKIRSWDRRKHLRFVPLQSDEANELLAGVDPERRSTSWHLVDASGRVYSAGAAVSPLLRQLPLGRAPAWVVERAPGLADRAYEAVARNRDRLGRIVGERACRVDPSSSKR